MSYITKIIKLNVKNCLPCKSKLDFRLLEKPGLITRFLKKLKHFYTISLFSLFWAKYKVKAINNSTNPPTNKL